jgi:hypothetical protein
VAAGGSESPSRRDGDPVEWRLGGGAPAGADSDSESELGLPGSSATAPSMALWRRLTLRRTAAQQQQTGRSAQVRVASGQRRDGGCARPPGPQLQASGRSCSSGSESGCSEKSSLRSARICSKTLQDAAAHTQRLVAPKPLVLSSRRWPCHSPAPGIDLQHHCMIASVCIEPQHGATVKSLRNLVAFTGSC